jgi:acyl phosphate:glycerol-3-phosphate acyltransferase
MIMGEISILLFVSIAAYVVGSVNVAIGVFRITRRPDPRLHGSGNPGATNVYRQAGPVWAAIVLLLDMGRAVAVAAVARWLLPLNLVPWVGLGLIMGNRFPCFHGFRGGKGVANYLGFSLLIAPLWSAVGVLAWGAVFRIWRTPFIASFALIFCLAAGTMLADGMHTAGALGAACSALFIVACHHRNMRQQWFSNGE